jgi:tryptophan 6-halogenase
MDRRIRSVVILGGGTAGWMAASYLGKALHGAVSITVLEAPSIPKIGVGEATVPNLQSVFFDYLGIAEDEWMRECNASFKMAVKFVNWRTPGPAAPTARSWRGRPDHFYHPFGLLPTLNRIPLSHYWSYRALSGDTDEPFDYACMVEPALMDAKRAPRLADGRAVTTYAWHFDAHLVADFLRRFATEKQGVVHIRDEMVGVTRDADGNLTTLLTSAGREITGDLFVDCSGFRGALINKVMGEPFLDMSDHLLCDSAVATAVPHDDERDGIEPYTSAIAMPSGWTWRIPLPGRFGTGYVFSSSFVSREQATRDFCSLWGLDSQADSLNQISFRVGRNRRSWVRNCVSIGLASCFLEPLESSGLYFTYAAIYQLVKHFPDRGFDQVLADRFNREIADMFDDTRDFLQAHFYCAPRTDTEFWRACKELRMSDDIVQKLAMYRAGLPINQPVSDQRTYYGNFDAEFRNFWTNGSYYCIFAGLGLLPDHPYPALTYRSDAADVAAPMFDSVRRRAREMVRTLPSTRDHLRALHGAAEL